MIDIERLKAALPKMPDSLVLPLATHWLDHPRRHDYPEHHKEILAEVDRRRAKIVEENVRMAVLQVETQAKDKS